MIALHGVSKTFRQAGLGDVTAVLPLDLELQKGSFTVIVGANGSGKSTLLDLIGGAQALSSGRVIIDGVDVTQLPEHRRSRWIARVFQNPLAGTAAELSIVDNFRLAALRTQRKRLRIGSTPAFRESVRARVAQLGMGLESKLDQAIGSLSGGQRQALTLLMTSMDHMSVLLLDEPTAALDPGSAQLVMRTAAQLIAEHGLTAVLITHNPEEALRLGDRLLLMQAGRVARDLNAQQKAGLHRAELLSWFHPDSGAETPP